MSDEEKKCPQGWDQKQLLAYVEREMDNSAREALEAHLKGCEICASEVESLQKMDVLLKHHPEIFHPDEQRLYRYVTASEDPGGEIARHLEACENCQEDAQLLKEMINARSEVPSKIPAMPESLLRKIDQLHPAAAPRGILERLYSTAAGLISAPLRMPSLALGTAAAVIVLVIISVPLWQNYHKVPRPDSGLAIQEAPAQKPSEAVSHETGQARQHLEKDKSLENLKRFREEADARNGVLLSPEPAMKYAPERKFEKPEDREQGHISSTLEETPAEIPRSVGTKEKSRSPAAGIAIRPEKEIAPSPRASKPQMPTLPMKREPSTQQYRARVDGARPEAQGPPASISDPRISVRIRIVDSEGKSIPGFKFRLPANLTSRYRLTEETESGPADFVLIRVVKRDGLFDLTASLFEPNSTRASRTVEASGIPQQELPDKIGSLISSLLEKK